MHLVCLLHHWMRLDIPIQNEQRDTMKRARNRAPRITLPQDGLTRVLLILFVVVGIATAVVAFIAVRYVTATQNMIDLPGDPVISSSGGTATGPLLQSNTGPTPRPWDGVSRVNMLMMGLDARDWEQGEIPRTDTMILFTVDPLTLTAGMLSIPRDLWVNIPGYDYGKINTAYYLGEDQPASGRWSWSCRENG